MSVPVSELTAEPLSPSSESASLRREGGQRPLGGARPPLGVGCSGGGGGGGVAEAYAPQTILVTGGAGFIGSHVVAHLIRAHPSYKVVVLDRLDYCANAQNLESARGNPNYKFVKGDITSVDLINYVLASERVDTIMHFAAQSHVDNSFGDSFVFTRDNVMGTHVLLEASKNHGIRRFIHVSTDEVYGENKPGVGDADQSFNEHSALSPTNPYSATKACAEMLCKAYMQSYGVPIIVTRGNNVYGPGQYPEKLIPKFMHLAMLKRPLPIHGDGTQRRSYLFVDDVAAAFDVILHRGTIGSVYNIGTHEEQTIMDVARGVCALFDCDFDAGVCHVEDRPFNDRRYLVDNSTLLALGWQPTVPWAVGLKRTAAWYRSHLDFWANIEGALKPHPRATMGPGAGAGAVPAAQPAGGGSGATATASARRKRLSLDQSISEAQFHLDCLLQARRALPDDAATSTGAG